MKVKVISRNPADYTRDRSQDIFKVPRNLDPALHPFEKAREYTRALNATKLDRVFAKPLVGALSGHRDGVYCMAKNPKHLACHLSGSADGELRVWNLTTQKPLLTLAAHKSFVRGLCFTPQGDAFLSASDDKTVKLWNVDYAHHKWTDQDTEPQTVFMGKNAFSGVDCHQSRDVFVTCGSQVDVWDFDRSEPVATYTWGADTINAVKFNRSEQNVFASCGTDRNIVLYDLRMNSPLAKLIMDMKTNALCWNPIEPFIFTGANEDHNCYTFDMRNMTKALHVHMDHVAAVIDIDYSPTGQEFVTGSYDRSLRIFKANHGRSRDMYHTRRMQHIFCVSYSMDSKYLLSGSDDTNIRLWKANASEKLGPLSFREKSTTEYQDTLKTRFKHLPEIKRIARHRHTPKPIYKASQKKRIMQDSIKRKEENERKHTKEGKIVKKSERKKHIVKVEE